MMLTTTNWLSEKFGVPSVDEYTPETFDEYLKSFVMVPKGNDS
jgi:hypothetical protein